MASSQTVKSNEMLSASNPSASIHQNQSSVTINSHDMPEEMQTRAIELTRVAIKENDSPRDIAAFVKKELDGLYGVNWHCIVGKSFGSYITHGKT